MRTGTRVAGYLAGLAVVFAGALGIGSSVGGSTLRHTESATPHGVAEHGDGHSATVVSTPTAAGLAVSADGYTLQPLATVAAGSRTDFRFAIRGADGSAITDFDVEHEKKLHLIVVNRDLSGYQHLHPELGSDGTWTIPLLIDRAGVYRVIADFKPAGAQKGVVLGTDITVPGELGARALPAVSAVAEIDGYTVDLTGTLTAGAASQVSFRISRAGRPVTDLQLYLGAYGHLVALRQGDVGYLHVHPASTAPGPEIGFIAEVPSAGTYRLYLDFRHGDTVRTAEFTVVVGGGA